MTDDRQSVRRPSQRLNTEAPVGLTLAFGWTGKQWTGCGVGGDGQENENENETEKLNDECSEL